MITRKDLRTTIENISSRFQLSSSISWGSTTNKIPFSVSFKCSLTGVSQTIHAQTVKQLYYAVISFEKGVAFSHKRNAFSSSPVKEDIYL